MKILTRCTLIVCSLISVSCATPPKFDGPVEDHIDVIFATHKDKPGYEAFKLELLEVYQRYQGYKPLGYKSMIIARDISGKLVHAYAYGSTGYSFGISYAKGKCRKARKKASIKAECVIFAKGDRIVLQSY